MATRVPTTRNTVSDSSILDNYVEFRANPEMDNKDDSYFCTLLGISIDRFKKLKKTDDTWARAALRLRRKTYAQQLMEVDAALFRAAKEGDHNAAKVVYARFDGWTPKLAEQKIINNTVLNFADLAKKARDSRDRKRL